MDLSMEFAAYQHILAFKNLINIQAAKSFFPQY